MPLVDAQRRLLLGVYDHHGRQHEHLQQAGNAPSPHVASCACEPPIARVVLHVMVLAVGPAAQSVVARRCRARSGDMCTQPTLVKTKLFAIVWMLAGVLVLGEAPVRVTWASVLACHPGISGPDALHELHVFWPCACYAHAMQGCSSGP